MNGNGKAQSKRPRSWRLWVGCWAVLFVIMHIPIPAIALRSVSFPDRVLHFIAYFVLTCLGASHYRTTRSGSLIGVLLAWALVYAGYAALDEWLQQFVRRTPSLGDWLADVSGILVATGISLAIRRRPADRLSEPAGDGEGSM